MRATLPSVCPHDCPSQCALQVTVEAGRITDVVGDARHPFTRGVICGKVHDYAERVYGPTRVLTPLRRVGPKGEGRFEPIGWDEAVDEIAHRWRRVIAQWGAEAILPFSYGGTLGLVQNRAGHALFYALGASRLDRTICVSTAYAGWQGTLGTVTGNDSEQMVDSELIVLWGINASHTHINAMTLVKQARRRGAFVVCVDPYRTPTARQADWHLMPRPGNGRSPGPGRHARAHRRGARGPGLHPARDPRLHGPGPARQAVRSRARGRDHRAHRGGHRGLRPPLRGHARRVHPGRHRALPPRQRRHDVPDHRVPARADRGLRASRGRRPAGVQRRVRPLQRGDRAAGPDAPAGAAGDQHDPARARAHRSGPGPAGQGALRLQREPGLDRAEPGAGAPGARARGSLHGGARAAPHRHHRLRRSRAPGHHVDGAHRLLQVLRPLLRAARPPGDRAGGRGALELGGDPAARARDGAARPALPQERGRSHPRGARLGRPSIEGITLERLEAEHSVRLRIGRPYLPFADGAPTPSGKVEFLSETMARAGLPALPTYTPLVEGPEHTELTRRYPLQCIVPPNRFFLNSSFSQSELHAPAPARARGAAAPGRRARPAASGAATRCWCGARAARRGSPPS